MISAPAHVRRASPADCAAISATHVRSWNYEGLISPEALAALRPERREPGWRAALSPGDPHRVWVAERGEALLGFAAWGPARDADARPALAELYAIYLEQAAAGTGIAEALMASALGEMASQGFDEATLWVLGQNPRARRFYERGGWRLDGAAKTVNLLGSVLEAVRYRRVVPAPSRPARGGAG